MSISSFFSGLGQRLWRSKLAWYGQRQFYRDWYTLRNSLPPAPSISVGKITGLVVYLVTNQS